MSTAPARSAGTSDHLVDAAIQQERRVVNLLRYFKPVVETYIQEDHPDSENRLSPKADEYFLSRFDLTGHITVQKFRSAEVEGNRRAKIPQDLTAEDLALRCSPTRIISTSRTTLSNLSAGRRLGMCAAPSST